MCAPCKIILNAGAAAAFEGGNVEAAMARATDTVVREFPEDVQNKLSHLDARALDGIAGGEAAAAVAKRWRKRLLRILSDYAGEDFAGSSDEA